MDRTLPLFKLLTVFLLAFSLASVTGLKSSHFQLPSIQPAHAITQTPCHVSLSPGCSDYWVPAGAAEDIFQATIFTDEASEFTNVQSTTPNIDFTDSPLTPDLTGPFTTSSNFQITSTISEAGYYEVQFMLAANFWGCSMNFGNSTCGVQIRQGIAHMIDTAKFAANEASIAGQAIALDDPVPSKNVGELSTANPCAWDASFPEGGTNCIVGAPGGTAYHLANATGADGFPWLRAPGSLDLNAAARHFVNAGVATGFNQTTSVLTGIASTALSNPVSFLNWLGQTTAQLNLHNGLSAQICYLFTGSYTSSCGYLISHVGAPPTYFVGFNTSTTTTISQTWGMYIASYQSPSGPSPFDHSLYFQYNSQFVSGIPSIKPPTGLCSSASVPTVNAADYMYLCDPVYDSLTSQMESASSLSSALSLGQQAEGRFGAHAYTVPIFELNVQFGYLNNGWTRVINNVGTGLPNYFTWLNAWNPNPVQPGTIRQGFKQSTTSVSPFIVDNPWNQYIVSNIYDPLTVTNPLSGGQFLYWSAISIQQLSNSGLTYTPPAGTTQSFRVTLRSDMFFQDGRKVTSFDVAFSYLALKGTGAFVSGGAAPMTGVTILGPTQFDIGVSNVGPFTLSSLTSLPILPGAYWTNAGSSSWLSTISACTVTNAACYPAQYTIGSPSTTTNCALICAFPATNMNVNVAQTSASYDPIVNHSLVGSGPWECGPVTSSGSSTSCSSSGAESPPVGGSYTLTRFGEGLAPASSISGDYFRSNGNLALWIWSGPVSFTQGFLNFSILSACFGTTSPNCSHWMMGIGGCGGTMTNSCPIGLEQISIVNRFIGVNWIAPFDWHTSPPFGIIPLNAVLYENTLRLNPASVASCATPYPAGGYDC